MFMRLCLYILNATNLTNITSPHQKKLLSFGTTIVCVIILSLSCVFPHGVYKKWPLNMLEFSFFLNLCITSALWTIFEDYPIVSTSAGIAVMTFLGILIYHVGVKLRSKVKSCSCLKLKIWLLKLEQKIPFKHQIGLCCFPSDNDETAPLVHQPLPPVVTHTTI